MALFVVIEDFTGPANLHFKENAVLDDALFDLVGLQAAGLQVVPSTPELLAAIAAGAKASKAQIVENEAGGGGGLGGFGNKVVGDMVDRRVTNGFNITAAFGERVLMDAGNAIATGTLTLPAAGTQIGKAVELHCFRGIGMTTVTIFNPGGVELVNGEAAITSFGVGTNGVGRTEGCMYRFEFLGFLIGWHVFGSRGD